MLDYGYLLINPDYSIVISGLYPFKSPFPDGGKIKVCPNSSLSMHSILPIDVKNSLQPSSSCSLKGL